MTPPVPPQPAPRSHTKVSHYLVGECIGCGGMGEVYEALDLELDRQVAIKFLPEHVLPDEKAVRGFLAETKSSSALNHPNLVTIHEFVRHFGVLAIVMERVEGQTLRAYIQRPQQFPNSSNRRSNSPKLWRQLTAAASSTAT